MDKFVYQSRLLFKFVFLFVFTSFLCLFSASTFYADDIPDILDLLEFKLSDIKASDGFSDSFAKDGIIAPVPYSFNIAVSNKNPELGSFKDLNVRIGFDNSYDITNPVTNKSSSYLDKQNIFISDTENPKGLVPGSVVFTDTKAFITRVNPWVDDIYLSESDLQLYLYISSWVYIDPVTNNETTIRNANVKVPLKHEDMLKFFPAFVTKSNYILPKKLPDDKIGSNTTYKFSTGNLGCNMPSNSYIGSDLNDMFLMSGDGFYSNYISIVNKYIYLNLKDMYYEKDGVKTKEYNNLFNIDAVDAHTITRPIDIDGNNLLFSQDGYRRLQYIKNISVEGFEGDYDKLLDGTFVLVYEPEIIYTFDDIKTVSEFKNYDRSVANKNLLYREEFDSTFDFNFNRSVTEKYVRYNYNIYPLSLTSMVDFKGGSASSSGDPAYSSTSIYVGTSVDPSGYFSTASKDYKTEVVCANKPNNDKHISNISDIKLINDMLYIPISNDPNTSSSSIYKDSGSAYLNSFINWNLGGRNFDYAGSFRANSGTSILYNNPKIKSFKVGVLKENPKFTPDVLKILPSDKAKIYYDWYDYKELKDVDLQKNVSAVDIIYDYSVNASDSSNLLQSVVSNSNPFLNTNYNIFEFYINFKGFEKDPSANNMINMGSKDIKNSDYWVKSSVGVILKDESGNEITYYNDSLDDTFTPKFPSFYPNDFTELQDVELSDLESFPKKDDSKSELKLTKTVESDYATSGFFENVDWSTTNGSIFDNRKYSSTAYLSPTYEINYVSPFLFDFEASNNHFYMAPALVDSDFYLNYYPLNENDLLKKYESKKMKITFTNPNPDYLEQPFYSYKGNGTTKEASGAFYLYSASNELLGSNLDNSLKIPYIETSLSEFPIRVNHTAKVDFSQIGLGNTGRFILETGGHFYYKKPFMVNFLYFNPTVNTYYTYGVPNSLNLSKNSKTPVINSQDDSLVYNVGLFNGLPSEATVSVLDVLPYMNDGRGSKFTGKLFLDSIDNQGPIQNLDIYYTDKPLLSSLSAIDVNDQFLKDNDFKKYTGGQVEVTGIFIKDVPLKSRDYISLDLNLSTDKLLAGDMFVNTANFSYNLGEGIQKGAQSGAAVISSGIPDRMISGMIFDDVDETGYFQPGVTPVFDETVDVALFDNNNKIVKTLSTSDGNYMFNNLEPGDYKVGFKTSGLDDGSYVVSKYGKEIDSNADVNFTNKVPNQDTEIVDGYYLTDSINVPDHKLVNITGINLGLVYQEPVETNKIININMLTLLNTKTNDFRPFFNEVTLVSDTGFKQTVASPAETELTNYRLVKQLLPKEATRIDLTTNLPLGYQFDGFKIADSIDDLSNVDLVKDGVINLSDDDIQDYYVEVVLTASEKIPYVSSVYLPLTK